jgi:TonB family protein
MKAILPALALVFAAAAATPLRAQAAAGDTVVVADSATAAALDGLVNGFHGSMTAHGIAHAETLLLLSRTQASAPVQVRVLEGTVPADVLAVIETLAQAVPVHPGGRTLLRTEKDAEPGIDSGATPPDARNRAQITRALTRFIRDHPEVGVPGQRFYGTVTMVLTRNGAIPYAQVERSTGSVRVDEGIMAAVKKLRIRPATVGGKPVETWVSLPVTLEVPPEAPPPTGNVPRPE